MAQWLRTGTGIEDLSSVLSTHIAWLTKNTYAVPGDSILLASTGILCVCR